MILVGSSIGAVWICEGLSFAATAGDLCECSLWTACPTLPYAACRRDRARNRDSDCNSAVINSVSGSGREAVMRTAAVSLAHSCTRGRDSAHEIKGPIGFQSILQPQPGPLRLSGAQAACSSCQLHVGEGCDKTFIVRRRAAPCDARTANGMHNTWEQHAQTPTMQLSVLWARPDFPTLLGAAGSYRASALRRAWTQAH